MIFICIHIPTNKMLITTKKPTLLSSTNFVYEIHSIHLHIFWHCSSSLTTREQYIPSAGKLLVCGKY